MPPPPTNPFGENRTYMIVGTSAANSKKEGIQIFESDERRNREA